MRKTFIVILSIFMLASCGNSNKNSNKNSSTQDITTIEEDTFVKSLDYKNFVKKVWDIETLYKSVFFNCGNILG